MRRKGGGKGEGKEGSEGKEEGKEKRRRRKEEGKEEKTFVTAKTATGIGSIERIGARNESNVGDKPGSLRIMKYFTITNIYTNKNPFRGRDSSIQVHNLPTGRRIIEYFLPCFSFHPVWFPNGLVFALFKRKQKKSKKEAESRKEIILGNANHGLPARLIDR